MLKSYFVQNGYQSDHLSVKSNSIDLNRKVSRKKQSAVESASSSDNLDKKYNKMDLREQHFDKVKRRREDKDSDFVLLKGKEFLMSVNLLAKDTLPLAKEASDTPKSASVAGSDVPRERWIIDTSRKKYENAEKWEEFMSKINVAKAQRVYFTSTVSNHPSIVMS